jgi:hypothetical protein
MHSLIRLAHTQIAHLLSSFIRHAGLLPDSQRKGTLILNMHLTLPFLLLTPQIMMKPSALAYLPSSRRLQQFVVCPNPASQLTLDHMAVLRE